MSVLYGIIIIFQLVKISKCSIKSTATFSQTNTGLEGFVEILLGYIYIDLDFTELVTNPTFFNQLPRNDCLADGMEFYVHTMWDYNDDDDRIGSAACSANFTSGHLDLWRACSDQSSSTDCLVYPGNYISIYIKYVININFISFYINNILFRWLYSCIIFMVKR